MTMASEFEMSPRKPYAWPMLNFAAAPGNLEFGDLSQRKNRTPRDPMSHRIIEKRRRDRMNNCLADLSHLIPATYLKQQGQGRIEKTEIIEMGIKHIHMLQSQVKSLEHQMSQTENGSPCSRKGTESTIELGGDQHRNFKLGFQECRDVAMKFLVERQELNAADPMCMNLMQHLQEQLNKYPPSQRQMETSISEEQKSTDNSRSSSSNSSSEFTQEQSVYNPLVNRVRVQQNLMSSRDLDEHLRGLLGQSRKKSLWASDTSSMMSDIQDSMQNSIAMNEDRDGLMSVEQSGTETSEDRRQDNFRSPSNYKFKNDIKLRFSADIGGKVNRSRTTSMISQEGSECRMKEGTTSLSSSDTTSFQESDISSSGNSNNSNGNLTSSSASPDSSVNSQSSSRENANVEVPPMDLANSVPGFALHPGGSYYIPVVTPASQLMPFIQNYSPSGICHPISIPVNFGGPYICMHNLHPGQAPEVKLENSTSPNNDHLSLQAKAH